LSEIFFIQFLEDDLALRSFSLSVVIEKDRNLNEGYCTIQKKIKLHIISLHIIFAQII